MAGFRGLFVRKGSTGTQPVDARKALAGLLAPASTLGARQGILAGPGDPLRVTGTAGWTYQVAAGPLVTSRSAADGAVLWGNDGAADTPAVAAAPASGARYDLIWMRHQDPDAGESDTPEIGVTSGAASGTPVRPAVPAGAVVLAEALVSAGATSTSHANVTITQVAPFTVARGGVLPCTSATRPTTGLYEGLTIYETDTDRAYVYAGSDWRYVGPGDYVCTRATRPTNPYVGMKIVETDSGLVFRWSGSEWILTTEGRIPVFEGTGPAIIIPNGSIYGMGTLAEDYRSGPAYGNPAADPWGAALDTLTVPYPGLWLVTAKLNWTTGLTGRSFMDIKTSDAVDAGHNLYRFNMSGEDEGIVGGSAELRITDPATQKVQLSVYQATGADRTYTARVRAAYRGAVT